MHTSFISFVQVGFVEQQEIRRRVKKSYTPPTDPNWGKQWALVRLSTGFAYLFESSYHFSFISQLWRKWFFSTAVRCKESLGMRSKDESLNEATS